VEDEKFTSPRKGDTKDVVVIGSSAAGLYTAVRVAQGGRRVSVLESKATPDPAQRTLIVTGYFKNQISSAARSSILNEIRRFELFTDGRSAQITLKQPDLIIERSRLIRSLAEEAAGVGAKLRYDTRFLDLSPNAKGLRVQVDQGGKREELHAASVVGADGAASRVAKAAGWPPVETVPLVRPL
jgi:flavin-dependent dehydrogenase